MTPTASAESLVDARGITKRFGFREALRGVDLTLGRGECVAVFGPNGAGKTTLIRILTLALRPDAGWLSIAGHEARTAGASIRQSLGVVSHQSYLYDDLTARQNLEFYGRLYDVRSVRSRAETLLARFGLRRRADDAVRTFSRGMQQRLSLARALLHEPQVLFLDEPFSGLDPQAMEMLQQTLADLCRDGCGVVLVTHDLDRGLDVSDRWIVLDDGKLVEHGAAAAGDRERLQAACSPRRGSPAPGEL